MSKKYNYKWVKIFNKKNEYRWVLATLEHRKKVIPKVRHKILNHVRRYTKR
jgi:hypothetical protein